MPHLHQGETPHLAAEYAPLQPDAAGGSDGVGDVERGSAAQPAENPPAGAALERAVSTKKKAGYAKVKRNHSNHAAWDMPDWKQGPSAEPEQMDAPKWFEKKVFKWLDRPRATYSVYALLGLTPFLTSLGSFLEMWYGCPTISTRIEGMFALGTFLFTGVWIFYFHGLRQVVRGAHKVPEALDVDERMREVFKQETDMRAGQDGEALEGGKHMTPRERVQTARHIKDLLSIRELEESHVVREVDEVGKVAEAKRQLQVVEETVHAEYTELYTERVTRGAQFRTKEDELEWMREKGFRPGRRPGLYLKQQRFTKAEAQYIEQKLADRLVKTLAEVKALGMDELREIASTFETSSTEKNEKPSEVGEYLLDAQRFTTKTITMIDQALSKHEEEGVALLVAGIDKLAAQGDDAAKEVLKDIFVSCGKVTEATVYQPSSRRATSTKLGRPERTTAYAIIKMDKREEAQVRLQANVVTFSPLLDSFSAKSGCRKHCIA